MNLKLKETDCVSFLNFSTSWTRGNWNRLGHVPGNSILFRSYTRSVLWPSPLSTGLCLPLKCLYCRYYFSCPWADKYPSIQDELYYLKVLYFFRKTDALQVNRGWVMFVNRRNTRWAVFLRQDVWRAVILPTLRALTTTGWGILPSHRGTGLFTPFPDRWSLLCLFPALKKYYRCSSVWPKG